MPEPRGPEGAKCKCGHSMDQHTDSMAAAPCAFWGCRCDDFDQDPAPSPPRAGEPNVRPEDTTGRLGFDCFFPGLEGTCPQCGHEHVSLMRSPKHGWLCWPCAAAEQFALGVQDAEAPSPSPAGPGEAEIEGLIEAYADAVDAHWIAAETSSSSQAEMDAEIQAKSALRVAVRALLARLRESRDAHEQSVLAALVQAGALRAEVARLGAENERLNKVAGENFAVAVEAQERIATARAEEREAWWDLVDRAANALNDSICASGNRVSTNMHWVNKLRRDGEALRTREAAP